MTPKTVAAPALAAVCQMPFATQATVGHRYSAEAKKAKKTKAQKG